ncbi:SufE family protein [Mycobacterium lepromatosis]|nr:SufE family protein [Mycobacterium lepromatosis]
MRISAPLAEVASDFVEVGGHDKLKLLLEFADDLLALPVDVAEAAMEPVPECQSPLFLHIDPDDSSWVHLYFSTPAEAPTNRGFAAILTTGLDHQPAAATPDGTRRLCYTGPNVTGLISSLRLHGMSGCLLGSNSRPNRPVPTTTGSRRRHDA